jgi:hypothetical protein
MGFTLDDSLAYFSKTDLLKVRVQMWSMHYRISTISMLTIVERSYLVCWNCCCPTLQPSDRDCCHCVSCHFLALFVSWSAIVDCYRILKSHRVRSQSKFHFCWKRHWHNVGPQTYVHVEYYPIIDGSESMELTWKGCYHSLGGVSRHDDHSLEAVLPPCDSANL